MMALETVIVHAIGFVDTIIDTIVLFSIGISILLRDAHIGKRAGVRIPMISRMERKTHR